MKQKFINRKCFFRFVLLIFLQSCHSKNEKLSSTDIQSKTLINISGSTTLGSVFKLYNEENLNNLDVELKIDANGTNAGYIDLISDKSDISMSSNKLTSIQLDSFKTRNINLEEVKVAIDAIVIIVNYENKVKQLTANQIKDIFSGKIKNWSEVGGEDHPINVISRDKNSGTYSFVVSHLLKENHVFESARFIENNDEILNIVSTDVYAISYTSLLHTDKVDKLKIAFEDGGRYIKPTVENVLNHKYQLYRGLYLYYKSEKQNKLKSLIDYVKNGALNRSINKAGFIPYAISLDDFELSNY